MGRECIRKEMVNGPLVPFEWNLNVVFLPRSQQQPFPQCNFRAEVDSPSASGCTHRSLGRTKPLSSLKFRHCRGVRSVICRPSWTTNSSNVSSLPFRGIGF
jgi:hypothetical protein